MGTPIILAIYGPFRERQWVRTLKKSKRGCCRSRRTRNALRSAAWRGAASLRGDTQTFQKLGQLQQVATELAFRKK